MKILVVMSNGFEEIEAITVVDVLRRAGIQVDVVGIPSTLITGKNGVRIIADKKFSDINPEDYEGLVIPGGMANVNTLIEYLPLLSLVERFNQQRKIIAAICAAPRILAKLGLLRDKKATIYPGLERNLSYPRPEKVVVDGNIVTSQGPGTAIEFSLKLVEILSSKQKSEEIRKEIVA